MFPDRRQPKEIRFGIGDVVCGHDFRGPGVVACLFRKRQVSGRATSSIFPIQSVDSLGNISVPYAGAIRAKGRTPSEVTQSIIDALKNRAIEPQAVVSLVEQRTSLISVLGEVNTPARFPASASGERVLDALTRAGGPKGPGLRHMDYA